MLRIPGRSVAWQTPVTAAAIAAALLAVVLAVVVPAQGTPNVAITKRVSVLEGKVKKLETKNKALDKTNKSLTATLACLREYVPVSSYGNPQGQSGYHYRNPDGAEVLTTALDITEQGQPALVNLPTVNSNCIQQAGFERLSERQLGARAAAAR